MVGQRTCFKSFCTPLSVISDCNGKERTWLRLNIISFVPLLFFFTARDVPLLSNGFWERWKVCLRCALAIRVTGVCSVFFLSRTLILTTCLCELAGVTDVDTNVEAKTVVVRADESVSPQLMLEKLQKVSCLTSRWFVHAILTQSCLTSF